MSDLVINLDYWFSDLFIHRGGLAGQLSRLQAREKSSVRMWSHQQNKGPSGSQGNFSYEVMRNFFFQVKGSQMLDICCLLHQSFVTMPPPKGKGGQ